jgi:hypothetical protein
MTVFRSSVPVQVGNSEVLKALIDTEKKRRNGSIAEVHNSRLGRQKMLFGKRGKLVIKKKGGPRHKSYN